jgi:hypothetical protein
VLIVLLWFAAAEHGETDGGSNMEFQVFVPLSGQLRVGT